jgi:hypothetical protein
MVIERRAFYGARLKGLQARRPNFPKRRPVRIEVGRRPACVKYNIAPEFRISNIMGNKQAIIYLSEQSTRARKLANSRLLKLPGRSPICIRQLFPMGTAPLGLRHGRECWPRGHFGRTYYRGSPARGFCHSGADSDTFCAGTSSGSSGGGGRDLR